MIVAEITFFFLDVWACLIIPLPMTLVTDLCMGLTVATLGDNTTMKQGLSHVVRCVQRLLPLGLLVLSLYDILVRDDSSLYTGLEQQGTSVSPRRVITKPKRFARCADHLGVFLGPVKLGELGQRVRKGASATGMLVG